MAATDQQTGIIIPPGGTYELTMASGKWTRKFQDGQTQYHNATTSTGTVTVKDKGPDGTVLLSVTGLKNCSIVRLTGTRVDIDGTS